MQINIFCLYFLALKYKKNLKTINKIIKYTKDINK